MNMKKNYAIVGLALGALVLTGTLIGVAFLQNGLTPETNDEKNSNTTIVGTGTIRYVDIEGGFYGIVSDENSQYVPYELPEKYQQDGLRITFSLEPLHDHLSIHMWGMLVEIVEIETTE